MFLLLEPIVTFFGLWLAMVVSCHHSLIDVPSTHRSQWGVFFIEIAGIGYVFNHVFGFGTSAAGSVFWCFT